ncbi:hypothetical protein M5689_000663 [Euphorbia peplus]|nr:hypothetical protein M5689_000663 [Euphorbia peplus]
MGGISRKRLGLALLMILSICLAEGVVDIQKTITPSTLQKAHKLRFVMLPKGVPIPPSGPSRRTPPPSSL